VRIPPGTEDALIECWPAAHLATLAADGRPHLVPVVFARASGRLWTPIDGKPKARGEPARVRHLRRDPRAALLLDHYAADWTRLWWLRLDAEAQVMDAARPERDSAAAAALAALRAKYPQYERVPLLGDPPLLIALRETRRASWCPGPDPPEVPRSSGH
jgi:PPOX class probable F420-dependent enzyme